MPSSVPLLQQTPFHLSIPRTELASLRELLQSSPTPKRTYENSTAGKSLGVQLDWMVEAKEEWEKGLEEEQWRRVESRINSFSHYKALVPISPLKTTSSSPQSLNIHFIHHPSPNPNAIPLLLLHGWPGSFLEFLPLLDLLLDNSDSRSSSIPGSSDQNIANQSGADPNSSSSSTSLPERRWNNKYHIIIPSLPGYLFSDSPPLETEFGIPEVADVMHNLMMGLGYEQYALQAGDWGALVARLMAVQYPQATLAVHLNFIPSPPPPTFLHPLLPSLLCGAPPSVSLSSKFFGSIAGLIDTAIGPLFGDNVGLNEEEVKGIVKGRVFGKRGNAYLLEHATRPATIGMVVGSSPIALLAWVGEKYLDWSDETPAMEEIVTAMTLWWLTDTFASSIYSYRGLGNLRPTTTHYIVQPTGFSSFAKELSPPPKSWAQRTCNLVWYKYHPKGGHFAALEKPEVLKEDLNSFLDGLDWRGLVGRSKREARL